MDVLPKLSTEEWKELVPQVGPRTVLRKAASEMSTDASSDIIENVQKLRDEKVPPSSLLFLFLFLYGSDMNMVS
jgi:hypothetical protein